MRWVIILLLLGGCGLQKHYVSGEPPPGFWEGPLARIKWQSVQTGKVYRSGFGEVYIDGKRYNYRYTVRGDE